MKRMSVSFSHLKIYALSIFCNVVSTSVQLFFPYKHKFGINLTTDDQLNFINMCIYFYIHYCFLNTTLSFLVQISLEFSLTICKPDKVLVTTLKRQVQS